MQSMLDELVQRLARKALKVALQVRLGSLAFWGGGQQEEISHHAVRIG